MLLYNRVLVWFQIQDDNGMWNGICLFWVIHLYSVIHRWLSEEVKEWENNIISASSVIMLTFALVCHGKEIAWSKGRDLNYQSNHGDTLSEPDKAQRTFLLFRKPYNFLLLLPCPPFHFLSFSIPPPSSNYHHELEIKKDHIQTCTHRYPTIHKM